jgi:hypothetical protein
MSQDDDIHPSLATPPLPTDLKGQQHATPVHTRRQRPRRLVAAGALLAAVMVLGGGVLFPVSGRIAGLHNAVKCRKRTDLHGDSVPREGSRLDGI